MSIREDVLQILRGSEATRFRFGFGSIYGTPLTVDHTTFLRVVSAIEDGRVQVRDEGLSPINGGEHDSLPENGGVFYARPIRNRRSGKSVVIHEAVHASLDLTRSSIAEVDNEAASFLAQFLYLRFTAYPLARLLSRNPGERRLYEYLWNVTASIERGGTMPETNMALIRRRISEHPNYPYVLTEGCFNGESDCLYTVSAHNG